MIRLTAVPHAIDSMKDRLRLRSAFASGIGRHRPSEKGRSPKPSTRANVKSYKHMPLLPFSSYVGRCLAAVRVEIASGAGGRWFKSSRPDSKGPVHL
jgi:hypothetical protein